MDISNIKSQLDLIDKTNSGTFAYRKHQYEDSNGALSGNLTNQTKYKSTNAKQRQVLVYHLEYELIRVVSGTFTLTINDHHYTLQEGQYAWIGAEQLHQLEIRPVDNKEKTCSYSCESLFFDLQSLGKILGQLNDFINLITSCHIRVNSVFDPNISEDSLVCEQLTLLFNSIRRINELEDHSHAYSSYAKRNSLELVALGQLLSCLGMIQLNQRYTSYEDKFNVALKSSLNKSVNLMRFIYDNYCSSLTLDDLAKVADLQPNYLCRFFKELTGKRPFDYINNLRINEAAKRLANSNQSVYQIAYACGFQDPCYFTRIFKKHMGISPIAFRKQSHPKPTQE